MKIYTKISKPTFCVHQMLAPCPLLLICFFVTAWSFETSEIAVLTHNYLRDPPESLSPDVSYVDLSYNNIVELNASSFQRVSSIKVLRICYNGLRTINGNAFKHLHNLSYVDFSHNRLTDLDPEILAFNVALRKVVLSHNPLATVDGLPLLSSPSLQFLIADHCSFTEFSSASFSKLLLLQTLSLLGTKAQAFKLDVVSPLVHLQEFSFTAHLTGCYDREAFSGLLYLSQHHVYHGLPFCKKVFNTDSFVWVLSGLIITGLLCLIVVVATKARNFPRSNHTLHHRLDFQHSP